MTWKKSKDRSGRDVLEFLDEDGRSVAMITSGHIHYPGEYVLRVQRLGTVPRPLGLKSNRAIEGALGVAKAILSSERAALQEMVDGKIEE